MIGFGAICRFSRVDAKSHSPKKGENNPASTKEQNMTTLHLIKSIGRSPSRLALLLIPLVFACFALSPRAQAVSPPPDGGYPGGNTAEGQNALLSLTTGAYNTAIGLFVALEQHTGNFNTAIGAGTLLANTGDNNTATGAACALEQHHRRRQHGQRCSSAL